jgi:hypothetical protein
MLEMKNPGTPGRALTGLGSQISGAAIEPENIMTILALKKIYERAAVSPELAKIMAQHAGLGPQAVRS